MEASVEHPSTQIETNLATGKNVTTPANQTTRNESKLSSMTQLDEAGIARVAAGRVLTTSADQQPKNTSKITGTVQIDDDSMARVKKGVGLTQSAVDQVKATPKIIESASPPDDQPANKSIFDRLATRFFGTPREEKSEAPAQDAAKPEAPDENKPKEIEISLDERDSPRRYTKKQLTRRAVLQATAAASAAALTTAAIAKPELVQAILATAFTSKEPSLPNLPEEKFKDLFTSASLDTQQPMDRFLYSYLKERYPEFPVEDHDLMKFMSAIHEDFNTELNKDKDLSEKSRYILPTGYINLLANVFYNPESYTIDGQNNQIGDWVKAFKSPPQGLSSEQLEIQQKGVVENITKFIKQIYENRKNKDFIVYPDGTIHNTFSDGKKYVYPSPSSSLSVKT